MRTFSSTTVLLSLLLAVAGCTTSTGGGGLATTGGSGAASSGAPIPIDQIEAAFVDGFCHMAATCATGFEELNFSSEAVCKEFMGVDGGIGIGDTVAKVKANKINYDAAKAGLCLKAFADQCSLGDEPPAACEEAFAGAVAKDGVCTDSDECAPGNYCDMPKEPCPGTCKTKIALGEACENADCGSGLRCDYSSSKCVEDKDAVEGESCESAECVAGLYCDHSDEVTCKKVGDADAACSDDDQCKTGLFCDESAKKCAAKLAADAACADPGAASCVSGHVCAIIGKMGDKNFKCLPTRKKGESCSSHQQCGAIDLLCKGLGADSPTGTCQSVPRVGEPCVPFSFDNPQFFACFIGANCHPTTKVCVPPGKVGEECGQGLDCEDKLNCDDNDGGTNKCVKETTTTPSCK